ncbi:MAG: gas vesicle protein GvpG [Chloroflexi bacterium]|nr:gas vesicle protein GvpG [Chloroflexota bacterium]
MGFLTGLLTSPVLGSPRLVSWLARKTAEEAERHLLDEDSVRAALLELQAQLDAGEMEEQGYDRQERELLQRLDAIRQEKARRARPG